MASFKIETPFVTKCSKNPKNLIFSDFIFHKNVASNLKIKTSFLIYNMYNKLIEKADHFNVVIFI